MDYCLGDGDGTASIWTGSPDLDLDGDGVLDAIGLDFDGDGLRDDALLDLDGDGVADHLLRDRDDGASQAYFTDDGSGSWSVPADRTGVPGRSLRWIGLDGAEQVGGPLVDFDGDGRVNDRLLDVDGDGLADRVLVGSGEEFDGAGGEGGAGGYRSAYVDTDGDGRWDVKLTDLDGDGTADGVTRL